MKPLTFALLLVAAGTVAMVAHSSDDPREPAQFVASAPELSPLQRAVYGVNVDMVDWYRVGFGSVMTVTVKFKNTNAFAIKDIALTCTSYANSGTKLDVNRRVIFERIKAGGSLKVREFNMGFIHPQASGAECEITNLVVV